MSVRCPLAIQTKSLKKLSLSTRLRMLQVQEWKYGVKNVLGDAII